MSQFTVRNAATWIPFAFRVLWSSAFLMFLCHRKDAKKHFTIFVAIEVEYIHMKFEIHD